MTSALLHLSVYHWEVIFTVEIVLFVENTKDLTDRLENVSQHAKIIKTMILNKTNVDVDLGLQDLTLEINVSGFVEIIKYGMENAFVNKIMQDMEAHVFLALLTHEFGMVNVYAIEIIIGIPKNISVNIFLNAQLTLLPKLLMIDGNANVTRITTGILRQKVVNMLLHAQHTPNQKS